MSLPALTLDGRELADLELIATGATPFRGFHGEADHRSILEAETLADGTPWPLPFALAVDDARLREVSDAGAAELRDAAGRVRGTVRVSDIHRRDPVAEARALYGTDDANHPGVAYTLSRPRWLIGGEVAATDVELPFAPYRLTPAQLRAAIAARGWREVAAFDLDGPPLRVHEELARAALEEVDGLVLHPLVGDELAQVRFDAFAALAARLPADRVLLAAFPAARRFAGPRETSLHALLRSRYGITSGIVGRDLAGAGAFYYRAPLPRVRPRRGFILWFTGMSGAGKSTLAAALAARLGGGRPLEVLDGDEVRTHLSKGLGFSREDRDVNVHRIAFVARTLARHGVGVVTAAISPYADTRRAVRELAEREGIAFVEVFARAEVAALVKRDPKGLYQKALTGELPHFTGISDPYEPPESPDVTVRTDQETVDESVATIIAALAARGLV